MSLAPEMRARLMPLFAFNVEVSRAPWMTKEPMIAEMRLQWWRDAIAEIGAGGLIRNHEVTVPLALVVRESEIDTECLDQMIAARRWDIYMEPFEDMVHFERYLEQTSGGLFVAAAQALSCNAADLSFAQTLGKWAGLANFLRAVPRLEASGKRLFHESDVPVIRDLAQKALAELAAIPARKGSALRLVHRFGWLARPTLEKVVRDTEAVKTGGLEFSEFQKRFRLLFT